MTYRELVYMCLDEIKLASDDSYITEDHILFLISKYRAFLLRQKYEKTNMPVSFNNYQLVESTVGNYVPTIMSIAKPIVTYTDDNDKVTHLTYVSPHRYLFVGDNKTLKSIKYCTIDRNNCVRCTMDVDGVSIYAVFEDILEPSKKVAENQSTDILDLTCPIETDLVSGVQELVVKDALGIAYRPTDFINNAADDLSKIGMAAGNSRKQ